MNAEPSAIRYPDLDALSSDLVPQIADNLGAAVAARGRASMVVSGGRSPVKLFECLRSQPLNWSRAWVAPAASANGELMLLPVKPGLRKRYRCAPCFDNAALPSM